MALWCYKWANSRSALYHAETIRDQLFVWNFFFINNGRHRTTALYRFPRSIGPRYNGAAVYCKTLNTVKILKFGTPQTIAIIVLKIEKFDVTLH